MLQGRPVQHLSDSPGEAAQVAEICAAIREAIGEAPAALHEPEFAGAELRYLKDCIDTGWVSSAGAYVERFERGLAELTGARHAVAIMNGTAALHLALVVAGVRTDDEVLVPALTFVATANAVAYCGATPHFVDSEPCSLGVDAAKLAAWLRAETERTAGGLRNRRTGKRIAALMPMHTFGHPADLDALAALCEEFSLPMVEDAAEAIGTEYKGRHVGHHGVISALSFNGNKTITTGGGGALITDDEALARRAKHLSTTARLERGWEFVHDEVGFNYRMPNLNAALGCAQLEQLPGFLADKRALAERYQRAFAGVRAAKFCAEPTYGLSNYWLNAILLEPQYAALRDSVLSASNAAGHQARPVWTLIHRLPPFSACPRMPLEQSESISDRLINLPSSARLGRHRG
jgi:perosamine synthetase